MEQGGSRWLEVQCLHGTMEQIHIFASGKLLGSGSLSNMSPRLPLCKKTLPSPKSWLFDPCCPSSLTPATWHGRHGQSFRGRRGGEILSLSRYRCSREATLILWVKHAAARKMVKQQTLETITQDESEQ